MLFLFWGMYTGMPNCKLKFIKQLPGAVFSSVAWIVITWAFSWYIEFYGSKSSMYGSLTTIILIMLWLYFGMYVIFIGGMMNNYLQKTDNLKNIV
jgi:membrane protein